MEFLPFEEVFSNNAVLNNTYERFFLLVFGQSASLTFCSLQDD